MPIAARARLHLPAFTCHLVHVVPVVVWARCPGQRLGKRVKALTLQVSKTHCMLPEA